MNISNNLLQANNKYACIANSKAVSREASNCLHRLCKHFNHKVPASWDEQKGHIQFDMGECYLTATKSSLSMRCLANDKDALSEIVETMQGHYERFCREDIVALNWQFKQR